MIHFFVYMNADIEQNKLNRKQERENMNKKKT